MRSLIESILDSDRELKDKINKASLPAVIVQSLEEVFGSIIKSKVFNCTWTFGITNRLEQFTGDKLISVVDSYVTRFCTSLYNKFKDLKIKVRYIGPRNLSVITDETRWNVIISYKSVEYILVIGLCRYRANYSISGLSLTTTDDDIIAALPKGR